MAQPLYRSLVSSGQGAHDLFTDRESESSAFAGALSAHVQRLSSGDDLLGDTAPRRNVLTYYGMGGIGKTELSNRLSRWLHGGLPDDDPWGPAPTHGARCCSTQLNLHGTSGAFDSMRTLVDIREALHGSISSWPAFDLAVVAFWEATRNGEPLPLGSKRTGHFSGAAGELANEVLTEVGMTFGTAGLGIRAVRRISDAIRSKRLSRKTFDQCPQLAEILEATVDRPTPELGVTLAWLLSQQIQGLAPGERPLMVVFLDTFEELSADEERRSEHLVNLLVYLMPYTLWVITGRNSLDWWDARHLALLPQVGSGTWPGLVPGSDEVPRQHLVGKLSERDARAFLVRARGLGNLPLDDSMVDQVVISSRGLPLYLDLCCHLASDAKAQGRELALDDVTGSIGSLVVRLLRDLPADERRVLRAGSLVPRFDLTTAAHAAGVDTAAALRSVARPLVLHDDHPYLPYRLHDEVRAALRAEAPENPGAWSDGDWVNAAQRMGDALKARHHATVDDPESRLATTVQALHLIAGSEIPGADWLDTALHHAPSLELVAERRPILASGPLGQAYLDFVSCWDPGTNLKTRRLRLGRLRNVDTGIGRTASRFYAFALRGHNQLDEAQVVLDELFAADPNVLDAYQRGLTYSMARRFTMALEMAALLRSDDVLASRLRGHVAFPMGRLDEALATSQDRYQQLQDEGSYRLVIEVRAAVVLCSAIMSPESLDDAIDAASDADRAHRVSNFRTALAAQAICHAGDGDQVRALTQQIEGAGQARGFLSVTYRSVLPATFDAVVRQDAEDIERIRTHALTATARAGRAWIPIEMLFQIAGCPLPPERFPTDWVDPEETVQARWTAIVQKRRELLGLV